MKKPVFIVEILIWLIIISVFGWLTSKYLYALKFEQKLITVSFKDIDGLQIGAPVNFMGVAVGSVKTFEMKEYQPIFSNALITERNIPPRITKGRIMLKIFRKIIKSVFEKIFKAIKSERKNNKSPAKILAKTEIKRDILKSDEIFSFSFLPLNKEI